jgi:hypothetical protein
MPLPDFSNPQTFPAYATLPSNATPPALDASPHYLLAQIGENMTITQPTLVLTDRAGEQFAMTFGGKIDFHSRGLKKGNTAVVPWATRMAPKKEGGNGFVAVLEEMSDMVKALPGGLEKVLEVGGRMRQAEEREDRCDGCGEVEGEGKLKVCTGCAGVRYCSKVSSSWFIDGSARGANAGARIVK